MFWNRLILDDPGHIKNFLCLITKQYIYRQKCCGKKLEFFELRLIIYQLQNVEKYIAIKNNRLQKHLCKWNIELGNKENFTCDLNSYLDC